jgi:BUD22
VVIVMPKRKRDEREEGQERSPANGGPNRQTASLRPTLARAREDLVSALKLSRGFERQKLGRRQKQASNEPKTLLRLREEVIVLKQLDLEKTASNYLVKYLSRSKRVRESSAFQKLYGKDPKLETVRPGAESNVVGRLVNSAPAKQAIGHVMDDVYRLLDISSSHLAAPTPSKTKESTMSESPELDSEDDITFEGFSDSMALRDGDEGQDSASDMADALLEIYQNRLANSEDDASHASSTTSRSISRSASPPQPNMTTDTVANSFLPTLNMGGYYSGSGSEEDDEPAAQTRKNRRGQQERRRIAELKYGNNAKHLSRQIAKESRNAGWDPQRGAIDRLWNHGGGQRFRGEDRSSSSKSIANNTTGTVHGSQRRPSTKARDDTGSLHPSWQAAKQRKEQSSDKAKFAGKKITFD